MDPVNKWLATVILFMAAFLIVVGWKAGSGRYEFNVQDSMLYENYAVVYVLDTKDGEVQAKLVHEEDLLNGAKLRPLAKPTEVFEWRGITSYNRSRY